MSSSMHGSLPFVTQIQFRTHFAATRLLRFLVSSSTTFSLVDDGSQVTNQNGNCSDCLLVPNPKNGFVHESDDDSSCLIVIVNINNDWTLVAMVKDPAIWRRPLLDIIVLQFLIRNWKKSNADCFSSWLLSAGIPWQLRYESIVLIFEMGVEYY